MYTPEEFAWAMKKRGYVIHIDSARKYVGKIGKEFYTEDDFPDAYRYFNRWELFKDFTDTELQYRY